MNEHRNDNDGDDINDAELLSALLLYEQLHDDTQELDDSDILTAVEQYEQASTTARETTTTSTTEATSTVCHGKYYLLYKLTTGVFVLVERETAVQRGLVGQKCNLKRQSILTFACVRKPNTFICWFHYS